MTEISPSPSPSPLGGEGRGEGRLEFGDWNLFGAWDLVIGILILVPR